MSKEMFNLVLVDGMNVCIREAFSPRNRKYRGRCLDVIVGFIELMISIRRMNPEASIIVAWDSGSKRRTMESKKGVEDGIVPEYYKENRKKNLDSKIAETMESAFEQISDIREMLKSTSITQTKIDGFEGDDIINTYVSVANQSGLKALIISSDKDFYQCLSDNVSILPVYGEIYTKKKFVDEYGFEPALWVDKGALEGETKSSGDNIFGIYGFGDKISSSYVRQYGDIENIIKAVLLIEEKSTREKELANNIDRLRLAKSLKKMDIIEDECFKNYNKNNINDGENNRMRECLFKFGLIHLARDCKTL